MAVTPKSLIRLLQKRPFQPFELTLSSGQTYAVRHPELMIVGRKEAHIGLAQNVELDEDTGYPMTDHGTILDLLHIVKIDHLPHSEAS